MPATIREVARKADVSVATVSRVLNGSDSVRPATREHVLETAQALQYTPNETARSLSQKQTRTVGVLLPDMHGQFFAQVIQGIEEQAQAQNYHVLVSSSHSEEEEARTMIRAMLGRVDGLVIMWPKSRVPFLSETIPKGLPTILLNAPAVEGASFALNFDNRRGARDVVRHLIEHGHRRIAMLAGASENHDARERLAGYRSALEEADLAADDDYVIGGDFTRESGYEAARRVLALSPSPTALFAANDSMAIGALRGLQEEDVRVPDDLALAGFDDIPTARFMMPGLTTAHVPMRRLGERAFEHLLAVLSGEAPDEGGAETLATELIRRTSCGCPPS